uniref:Uncharacterized protein n=1 Tax=Porodaedalea pini TaxID=108901 RepID=A0A5B9RAS0_9AGAM|nr:hypothetical protein PPIT_000111 [Porodaedalea pini]QEG57006.1 hypothetical protein PPIT_000111 [Porodaedalea pini]
MKSINSLNHDLDLFKLVGVGISIWKRSLIKSLISKAILSKYLVWFKLATQKILKVVITINIAILIISFTKFLTTNKKELKIIKLINFLILIFVVKLLSLILWISLLNKTSNITPTTGDTVLTVLVRVVRLIYPKTYFFKLYNINTDLIIPIFAIAKVDKLHNALYIGNLPISLNNNLNTIWLTDANGWLEYIDDKIDLFIIYIYKGLQVDLYV